MALLSRSSWSILLVVALLCVAATGLGLWHASRETTPLNVPDYSITSLEARQAPPAQQGFGSEAEARQMLARLLKAGQEQKETDVAFLIECFSDGRLLPAAPGGSATRPDPRAPAGLPQPETIQARSGQDGPPKPQQVPPASSSTDRPVQARAGESPLEPRSPEEGDPRPAPQEAGGGLDQPPQLGGPGPSAPTHRGGPPGLADRPGADSQRWVTVSAIAEEQLVQAELTDLSPILQRLRKTAGGTDQPWTAKDLDLLGAGFRVLAAIQQKRLAATQTRPTEQPILLFGCAIRHLEQELEPGRRHESRQRRAQPFAAFWISDPRIAAAGFQTEMAEGPQFEVTAQNLNLVLEAIQAAIPAPQAGPKQKESDPARP